jgi:inhibitor of cysteine peptidase
MHACPLWVIVLSTVLVLISGCSSSGDVELVASDAGRQVQVERGDVIVVTLESNPTTGYRWEAVLAGDGVLMQEDEAEYQESQQGQPVVGAGGQEVLRFRAQGSGTTTLQLVYHRPWEDDVAPERTFAVQVTVR